MCFQLRFRYRSEFPDFGDLFLAHLYERCPFLIPCYFAKKEGMSEEDYYKKLGYLYQDSQVEDQVNLRRPKSEFLCIVSILFQLQGQSQLIKGCLF